MAGPNVVAILTRAPSSGGKNRLFASLGRSPDPELLSALLLDTLDGMATPGARVVVVVTPPDACVEVEGLVGTRAQVMPQADGDLGARMRDAMATLLAAGARAVAIVGSDLPAITPEPIRQAFSALDRDGNALVLGPASDGGYYLIAAALVPRVFDGIAWGTSGVLEQTHHAAEAAGMSVHLLGAVGDVDTAGDLRGLCQADIPPESAARTRAWAGANLPDAR